MFENCFQHHAFLLKDDQDYLIKQAHVGHIIKPEWKNPTRGVQTKDVIKNYFTQLSKTQINELYEMFRYVYRNYIRYFSPDKRCEKCMNDSTYVTVRKT